MTNQFYPFDNQLERANKLESLRGDAAGAAGSATAAAAAAALASAKAFDATSLPIINAIEGDSRADYCHWGNEANGIGSSWRGFALWLQMLTNQRLKFPGALNTAVSGNTTTQILQRMPTSISAAVAAGASAMWLIMGINDRISVGAITYAQSMANVAAIIKLVRDANLVCFLFVDTSQGSVAFPAQGMTQTDRDNQRQSRDAYRALHDPRNGIYIFDVSASFDDPLATLNYNLDTMVADGTHDQIAGSEARALAALPTVNALWKPIPFAPFTSNSQQYSAANNPLGCLTANPMVDGTGGAINASAPNATGQVATGWSFGATALGGVLTAALSKVAKADGTVWQQAAISGNTGSGVNLTNYPLNTAQLWFYQTISLANAPVGRKVEVAAQFEYDAGNANVSSIIMGSEAAISGGTVRNYHGYRGQTVANPMKMPAGPRSFPPVANEAIKIPTGTTVHIMRIGVEIELPSVAVAMTFRFRAAGARLVG